MKNLTILIFALLFTQITAFSQPCLPQGITFTTQAQIDNFQINYPNCTEVEGDVSIGGFSSSDITNLDSLNVINSIGGALGMGYGFPGSCNPNLTSLTGLENLTYIGGDLTIAGNNVLTSLTGLESLTSIGGDIRIFNNNALVSLTGLDNIYEGTIIDIYINNNGSLSTCEATWLCDYLANPNGSINIYNNASGCNNPPEVADDCGISIPCLPYGNYYFYSQDEIDSFQTGYPNCTELEGNIRISGSDINNLFGLNVVISIDGDLYFYDNNVLTSLGGLENVTSIGGKLQFTKNSALESLMGMEGLTSIGGSLIVGFYQGLNGGNPWLTSLTGLDGLTSIGGSLRIIDNAALTSFDGLENVTSIGYDIKINQNHALTSLTGLDNIEATSIVHLIIINNSLLSTCEVQSVCDYLVSTNGGIDIHNNAPGCNSPEEVEEACITSVGEISFEETFTISPNPCSGFVKLRFTIDDQRFVILDLFEISGVKIKQLLNEEKIPGTYEVEIDLSSIPAGVYFCVLKTNPEDSGQTKKIVKL